MFFSWSCSTQVLFKTDQTAALLAIIIAKECSGSISTPGEDRDLRQEARRSDLQVSRGPITETWFTWNFKEMKEGKYF